MLFVPDIGRASIRGRTISLAALLVLPLLSLGCAGTKAPPQSAPEARLYDVVIEGGKVVDGSGNPWFYGDVAVRAGRIARIAPAGMLADAPARTRIDAEGLVVAPGFVDINGHSGGDLLRGDGRVISKVTQGITTEILGESTTPAPLNRKMLAGSDRSESEKAARLARFGGAHGFGRWLEAMEANGMSVNVASFVGGSTVRAYGMQMNEGAPSAAALDTMRAVVRRAMRDGALGIATALIYPPGSFASTGELVEISEAMAPYGGVYITHMRSEGDRLLQAAGEAIEIGRRAGVPVEIFHLKAAGRRNWGKLEALVDTINAARAAGHDVQANMYPYPAASTGLSACLPPWAFAEDRFEERLRDSTQRARIRRAMRSRQTDWENWCQLATPEGVLLVGLDEPENQQWEGQRLAAVAEAQDQPWTETALELIASEGGISTVYFAMSEQNMRLKLRQPWIKFGTDASARNPETARGLTHPRAYGTYPRILSKYVREDGVLPLEDAIRKMTSAVTTRLSIEKRGLLRSGFFADIVVFDPETIDDRATFQQPHQLSQGVRHVLVNGTFVLRNGEHTHATPGRAVRGPGYVPAASAHRRAPAREAKE